MRKNKRKNSQNETKVVLFICVFLVVVFIFIKLDTSPYNEGFLYSLDGLDERNNDLLLHGVISISIITEKELFYVGERGYYYGEVKKLYINNKLSNPGNLYRKEDFFLKYCEKYYYLYHEDGNDGGLDSIVYKFYPENKIGLDRYDSEKKLTHRSQKCIIKRHSSIKKDKILPLCD